MKIDVHNIAGEVVGSAELDDSVWKIEPNIGVMHQALLRQQANARLGTHDTKTRSEVRGGGRKPWRQKGTGRARQGSTRSPNWVGGGVVWGPHPRKYTQRMPQKMRHLAVRSALSAKLRDERVVVLADLNDVEPKTKAMIEVIEKLPASRSYLIVTPENVESVERGVGNLSNVRTILAPYLNVRDVLKYERLVVSQDALSVIEGLLALPADRREPSSWKLARMAAKAEAESEASDG
jgi:large subunit ribosomal protein L4